MPLLALYAFDRMGPRLASVAIVALVLFNLAHTSPKGIQTYDEAYYSADFIAQKGINTTTREEYEPKTVYHRPVFDGVLLKGVRSTPAVSRLAVELGQSVVQGRYERARTHAGFALRLPGMDSAG